VPTRLAPSRPDGVELGPVPHAASPISTRDTEGPFRRGSLIHTLLQHLPTLPTATRRDAARRWLMAAAQGVKADEASVIADETMAVLENPDLAPLFGPGSRAEAPLTGIVRGSVVGGLVDRIAILPDRVLICDYKTGRDAPDRAEDTPVLYCRQMAAYRDVLRAIYPDRPVTCALVWTRAARITVLPDAVLDASLMPGAGSTMSRP
jgi:ATP-dependent helicase/nuclease subunit A